MAEYPRKEFGKRKPTAAAKPPEKRSSHVALLLMGTLAVGGTAYTLMPSESCTPSSSPAIATPAPPQDDATRCTSRSSSSGSSGRYSSAFHFSFGGDSSAHSSSSSGSSSATESGSVSRGGFGSMAHAFGLPSSS